MGLSGPFIFFARDSEGAFGSESATREACFGPELDGEKLWRGQVFGARMGARKERKLFFSRDSEGAFGSESVRLVLDQN